MKQQHTIDGLCASAVEALERAFQSTPEESARALELVFYLGIESYCATIRYLVEGGAA